MFSRHDCARLLSAKEYVRALRLDKGPSVVLVAEFDLIVITAGTVPPEVTDALILLRRLGLPGAAFDGPSHVTGNVRDQQHAAQDGKSHNADINDDDCRKVMLVDFYLVNRVHVDCQLHLGSLVIVNCIEVAQEDVAKDEELSVADHVGRLDDSEDAVACKLRVDVMSI